MHDLVLAIPTAGPAVFLVTALAFGTVKPSYRPFENTISELALGSYGVVQVANFAGSGLLIVVLGLELIDRGADAYPALCVVVMGAVLCLSSVFRTDPIEANGSTATGRIHNALFLVGMLAIFSAQLVLGASDLGAPFGIVSLACLGISLVCLARVVRGRGSVGLFQRLLVLVVMGWITSFALQVTGPPP
jgi:hypothetical membrane protein